jgi:putative membrane protein
MTPEPLKPRVIEGEARTAPSRDMPQVIMSERGDRVVAVQPPPKSLPVPKPTTSRVRSFGLVGLGVFVTGWFIVDAYWWIAAAFERSTALGTLAATAVAAGVAGAGAIIAREVTSLWRLRDVETIRQRFDQDIVSPRDAQKIIADIVAVVPREPATQVALETFQRQVQPHHNVAQQVEILSRTVMKPLDARAEEHIRAAVVRAFGITAISPTAVSDALFFLAVGVRMVRRIAATYGHRPTAAATVHLLRRLLVEAG